MNLIAQPKVLKLWPDGIPGSKNDPSYLENIVTTEGRVTRANNFVTPDLTVSLPDPAKANGAPHISERWTRLWTFSQRRYRILMAGLVYQVA